MTDSSGPGVSLLVGTRKGLFRATSDADRHRWEVEGPLLEGYEVYHARTDPRHEGVGYAAVRHEAWGFQFHRTADGGRTWSVLPGRPALPEEQGGSLEAVWHVAPGRLEEPDRLYCGAEPASLFVSEDRGESWRWLSALEEHPTRDRWQPAKGGLALTSVEVDPREEGRLYVGISAGGVYGTDDGGESWRALNRGVRADFLPEERPEAGQCVHSLRLHPRRPDRLYQQNHCGTYRSDDRGGSWTEIGGGLPSDFGYALGIDPDDPDRCWVIPQESSHMRSVCDAKLRVFETRDAGRSWTPRTGGLPQSHAYVSVLREAMDTDGLSPCGVYFGTSTGHLFASPDGRTWTEVAGYLPRILSVSAAAGA